MEKNLNHSFGMRASITGLLILSVIACNQESSNEDTSFDYPTQIVEEGAHLSKLTEGYTFDTAGSPLYLNGELYFTNNNFDPAEQSRTFRMSSTGEIDTLASDNGVVTTLQLSADGTIYACEMLGHRVVELDTNGELLRVISDEYNGKRIDGPNDIVIDQKGGLYFSDSQFIAGRERMQETPAVYYVNSGGEITRVIDDIEFPNGLALSPDGSTLYVANTTGIHLLAFDVNEDGTVENKRNFAVVELAENGETSGADGMAIDEEGNLYVATTQGLGVQVFNNKGEHLGNISVPSATNNVSFGGDEGRTLYVSAQDGIYSIPVKFKGL